MITRTRNIKENDTSFKKAILNANFKVYKFIIDKFKKSDKNTINESENKKYKKSVFISESVYSISKYIFNNDDKNNRDFSNIEKQLCNSENTSELTFLMLDSILNTFDYSFNIELIENSEKEIEMKIKFTKNE